MKCVIHRDEDALFNCYLCKSPICVECESKLNGKSACPICLGRIRDRKAAEIESETKHLNCSCACVMGAVAAAATAYAWSQFVVMTGNRLDVLAFGVGALTAYGVMRGAGGKRGYNLQQYASLLALVGILFAHFLILVRAQQSTFVGLSGGRSDLLGALYAFPGYLSELGGFGWLCLVGGAALAYHLPHPRGLPEA